MIRDLAKSICLLLYTMAVMALGWIGLAAMNFSPRCRKYCTGTGRPLNDPPIIMVFTIICILVLMWFLPHVFQTYVWIYRTSFGDLAVMSKPLIKPSVFSLVHGYIQTESMLMVVGVSLVALFAVLMIGIQKCREVCFSLPFIYLLLLAPFSIWEVLNTIQTSARKLSIAIPALILVLLLVGLQRGKGWIWRNTIVMGLLFAQFVFAINVIYPGISAFKMTSSTMGNYPQPIMLQPNPHDEVKKFLRQQVGQYHYTNVLAVVNAETVLPVILS